MSYFPDGSPYTFSEGESEAVNVGWLDAEHEFPTEEPSDAFVLALARLCRRSVNRTRGYHRCQLCPPSHAESRPSPTRAKDGEEEFLLGDAEVRVRASNGAVYAAPNLIVHYVAEHKYRPPAALLGAVLDEASLPE